MQYKRRTIFGRKKYLKNQEFLKPILPIKKNLSKVIHPVETKNCYSPLETEESLTGNENTRTDSPNTKITAKQNSINTATQNTQNSNDKT